MTRLGVTGGIGSGKSTVCKLFSELGAPVYYSDGRARELMTGEGKIKRAVVALLGPEAYRGEVPDSFFIAGKVFSDKILLASLNAIVHPAVAEDFEAWALSLADRPYVVLESAILFESGFDRLVDRIVTVSAPARVRLERVMARTHGDGGTGVRGGISREEVLQRMAGQMSDAEREARADWTIDNTGGFPELAAGVEQLDKRLKL